MSLLAGNPVHVYTLLWRLVTLLPGLRARVGARRVKVSTKVCGKKYTLISILEPFPFVESAIGKLLKLKDTFI